jgi:hypothetical protein
MHRQTSTLTRDVPSVANMNKFSSAVTVKSANGPLQIAIAIDGDFTIQLVPGGQPLAEKTMPNSPQPKRARVVQFRCSRTVLNEHSSFLSGIFQGRPDLVSVRHLYSRVAPSPFPSLRVQGSE